MLAEKTDPNYLTTLIELTGEPKGRGLYMTYPQINKQACHTARARAH